MDALNRTAATVRPRVNRLAELSDEDLLLRYRQTDRREYFVELVRRYERELYSYLRRYLGSVERAEDAFQAVFLQVHLKCEQFQEGRPFRPWLYAIATNQAIDTQRRERRALAVSLDRIVQPPDQAADWAGRWDRMLSREADPADQAGDAERDELMQRALGELSEQMQAAVQLVFFQGLKYREAAEALAVPVGTVKSRVHAAVQRLAQLWRARHPEVD